MARMSSSTPPGTGVGPEERAGAAEPSPRRVPLAEGLRRQILLLLVLVAVAAILATGAATSAVLAGRLLAALLIVVSLLRACLPRAALGALVVRSRGLDVLAMLVLAGGLAVLSAAPNL